MRQSGLIPFAAAMLGGFAIAVQPPTNAMLARASGSTLLAGFVSFATGAVLLFVLWLALDGSGAHALPSAPPSAWLGGLYGAIFVCACAFAAPRIGLAATLTALVTSQIAVALLLDHFGALGLPVNPLTPRRAGGALLILVGAFLARS